MAQVNFFKNYPYFAGENITINHVSLKVFPINVYDSVSFNSVHMVVTLSNANQTHSFSLGLYSLNGGTLSIANSASTTLSTNAGIRMYLPIGNTSATQNITPGTWFVGVLHSSSGVSMRFFGQGANDPSNAFPNIYAGGQMTVSTNALPATVATSDFSTTGLIPMNRPMIIISG